MPDNKKESKEQIAVCESVDTVSTVKGMKQVYRMSLNGVSFELWESKYFSASPGQMFRPLVSVAPRGYIDKNGKPRGTNQPVVDWVLV